ncbi:MAG TPA: hypothetical protein VGI54_01755, partial [Solirubrobacteraceae bacterium]
ARLELVPPKCGGTRTTELRSHGDFVVVAAGATHIRTGPQPATITIRRACGRRPTVKRRR